MPAPRSLSASHHHVATPNSGGRADRALWGASPHPVPFVPKDILARYAAYVPTDDRLTAASRMLAVIARGCTPAGTYTPVPHRSRSSESAGAVGTGIIPGRPVRLGSRLSPPAARAGLNFLTPEIAAHAREVLLRRDYGVILLEDRILSNMLSSTAALINLLGPLALDLDLATAVFARLLPADFVGHVEGIRFETAGPRGDEAPLDKTAFDALIDITTPDGEVACCAIEFKLTEGAGGTVPPPRPGYAEATRMSGLYRDPDAGALTRPGVEQLRREGILAQDLIRRGVYGRCYFVLMGPAQNRHVQAIGRRYAAELLDPTEGPGRSGFKVVTVEDVVAAIAAAGASAHAAAFFARYLDWDRVARFVLDGPVPSRPPGEPTDLRGAPRRRTAKGVSEGAPSSATVAPPRGAKRPVRRSREADASSGAPA